MEEGKSKEGRTKITKENKVKKKGNEGKLMKTIEKGVEGAEDGQNEVYERRRIKKG